MHETILSVCSGKLPRSWDEDATISKNTDRETILHAAQVFRSAFESRWSSLLKRISAESLSEKRPRLHGGKRSEGKDAANYDKGAGAVGKVVEVYWEGEGEWFRGRLTRYRGADQKHRCDYFSMLKTVNPSGLLYQRTPCAFLMVMLSYLQRNKRGKSASRSMVFLAKNLVCLCGQNRQVPLVARRDLPAGGGRVDEALPAEPARAAKRRREGDDDGPVFRRRPNGCAVGCRPRRALFYCESEGAGSTGAGSRAGRGPRPQAGRGARDRN